MKRYLGLGAALCLAAGVAGCSGDDPAAPPAAGGPTPVAATFDVTDKPGYWFDTRKDITGTGSRSLAITKPGDKITFHQIVESRHTVTSLIWPANAKPNELIDQDEANVDDHEVTLTTPGLYVFVCKVHPYMLGGVIVDEPTTTGLDLGEQLRLAGVGVPFNSSSDLALRLVRALFIVTSPSNWKDYTKVGTVYQPLYPKVDVRVNGGAVVNLNDAILAKKLDGGTIPATQTKPDVAGIGEVWVDSQYELTTTKGESYPGTITVVDVGATDPANRWKVTRKIGLPKEKMNNGHNLWASHDQSQIYQTEWHGKSLYVLNRVDGKLLQEIEVGHDPAHVMTRVDTQQVHTGLNGEDSVVELDRDPVTGLLTKKRDISMQDPANPTKPTQPHAHWMGHNGKSMATPNANTGDSSFFDFDKNKVVKKEATGPLPIAAAMDPRSTKTYVSNYLGHTTTVLCGLLPATPPIPECVTGGPGSKIKEINLLANYDLNTGTVGGNGAIGGLPIQTPVSPDGKFVVTGNTLTGTITIIDAKTDTLVKSLTCDPGCHGVNFGAKKRKGGSPDPTSGYYAYVTSKFANRLLVYDIDPDGNGDATDATLVGWVVLADDTAPHDDAISGHRGMGGQGLLPVPNVYNGWVQQLPNEFKSQLTAEQQDPVGAL